MSALGKVIPDAGKRKKILYKGSHLMTLLRILKNTDWSETPVYYQFLRNGRWKHEDEKILSENELQYNLAYIVKLKSFENSLEEFSANEAQKIIEENFSKTMETMEVLMNQMNMMYHWEKVKIGFIEQESITLDDVEKLLMRCLKLYKMID